MAIYLARLTYGGMTRLRRVPSIVIRIGCATALLLLSDPAFARRRGHSLWDQDQILYSITAIICVGALIGFMLWLDRSSRRPRTAKYRRRQPSHRKPARALSTVRRHSGMIALVVFMGAAFLWTSGLPDTSLTQLVRQVSVLPSVIRPSDATGSGVITVDSSNADRTVSVRPIIIDGDTFSIAGEKIRILNIDTPESFKSRCEHELVLALRAKQRLREVLDTGPIEIDRDGRDRYGRTLARVYADGQDIGAILISEGHALPYEPGGNAKLARLRVWCGAGANFDDRWSG
jgi:endonuclease YncB( thermonuclease family)